MRKMLIATLATAAFGSVSLMTPAEAQNASLTEALAKAQQADTMASYVQYYRGDNYGYRRGYRADRFYGRSPNYGRGYYGPRYGYYDRPNRYYRRDRGSAAAAGVAGLAAGALLGGAIASQQAQAGQQTAQNRQSVIEYCQQRYRSYDPATGTYLGYDGRRHPCP